jgi:DNA polymerase III subunit epsilon
MSSNLPLKKMLKINIEEQSCFNGIEECVKPHKEFAGYYVYKMMDDEDCKILSFKRKNPFWMKENKKNCFTIGKQQRSKHSILRRHFPKLFVTKESDFPLFFLDTETTGIIGMSSGSLIDIAIVKVVNNKIIDKFQSYVKPKGKFEITNEALNIHGITKDFLSDKPEFDKVFENIMKFINLDFTIFISHNYNFDYSVICNSADEYGIDIHSFFKINPFKFIDTIPLFRDRFNLKKLQLDEILKFLKIKDFRNKHSALEDAILLSEAYGKLFDI